jgi:hypothetical protein
MLCESVLVAYLQQLNDLLSPSGFSNALNVERASQTVVESCHCSFDLDDCKLDESKATVGCAKLRVFFP